jgi:hypothetical protein
MAAGVAGHIDDLPGQAQQLHGVAAATRVTGSGMVS